MTVANGMESCRFSLCRTPSADFHRPLPEAGRRAPLLRRASRGRRRGRLPVLAASRLSTFFSSNIGLDSQVFQTQDTSQLSWVGPVPGDIAEVEAYCRIFRTAEQLHKYIMETLCNPITGECMVSYNIPPEDMPLFEEKVVAILGCMVALLNRGREDVLSGRSSVGSNFRLPEAATLEDSLPPLAVFRSEMKRCCQSLHVALEKYLFPYDDRITEIWKRLQRLKNVCYDAGFPRSLDHPCQTIFANWSPVLESPAKEENASKDGEVAFWRGGQVTEEGLGWLIENGFKTIVDLRAEPLNDKFYEAAVEDAISSRKIEMVSLPVDVRTAPSMEQVEQFAVVVADMSKRPVYLHSQEGVWRASAMVSRWKQYSARCHSQLATNLPSNMKGNGAAQPNGVETIDLSNGSLVKDVDMTFKSSRQGSFNIKRQDEVQVDSTNSNGSNVPEQEGVTVEREFSVNLSKIDPFNAQLPACNIFSKSEMSVFLKSKKLSPSTFVDRYEQKSGRMLISPGRMHENISSEPVSSQKKYTLSEKNSLPSAYGSRVERSHTSSTVGVNGLSKTESLKDSSKGAVKENNPATVKKSMKEKVKLKSLSITDDSDFVEENMCASATGVVRVQSRRKAEMFLVRTDGFSCTREKVTESSLAFTHPSTQQQMLMWKSPPRTVLLLKKLGQELMEEAKEVAAFLYYQEKMNVLVEPDVHDIFARIPGFGFVQTFYNQDTSDLHERVDFVACLGGDGVILHASNLFRGAVPPVVSFNLGSLGFLTSHAFEDFKQDLKAVIHGNNTVDGVYITLRMRLRCEIFRNGKAIPGKVFDVLNEVVVDRGSNPYLSKIECYEHDRLITKVQGDGVIIATPTGSTAYSTAAGGSMVHPNVPCMLFTPICPHSLSFRPVILPDSARLELKIPEETRSNAWVSFDGKRRQQLSRGDSVKIYMSQHPLPTVNKSDQTGDWFHSLIRCLNWNERLDQKAL